MVYYLLREGEPFVLMFSEEPIAELSRVGCDEFGGFQVIFLGYRSYQST